MFKPHYGTCNQCGREDVVIVVKAGQCQICNEKNKGKSLSKLSKFKPNRKKISDDEEFYTNVINEWEEQGKLYCMECGLPLEEPTRTNVAHILNKNTYNALRYDRRNVIPLCFEHHHELDHGDPQLLEIYDWVQDQRDQLKYETL